MIFITKSPIVLRGLNEREFREMEAIILDSLHEFGFAYRSLQRGINILGEATCTSTPLSNK